MDPLSQGVIGAVAAQQKTTKNHFVIATILGFLSGMAADLDIFIRSSNDPLLYLEFHRQFTHSLIFIPVGGFVCAIFFYYLFLRNREITFKQTYIYCTLGYATHGLLDSCTTYGTAFRPTFRTYINDMIHLFDYIHIVFDDNHGVSFVDQSVKYVHQYPNVLKV